MFSAAWMVALALTSQDTLLVRLRKQADSLAEEWRRANRLALLADSLDRERAAAGRDTFSVGALRVVANPSPLPLREAAARAWPVIDSLYGNSAQNLATRAYFIRALDPDTTVRRPPLRVGFEVPWDLDAERLTTFLLSNVPIDPPDHALAEWLGGAGPIRPLLRSRQDQARVYVSLVTSPSTMARQCFLGAIDSCQTALGLRDSTDAFLQWYPSVVERRALLLRTYSEYFNRGSTSVIWRACITGNDESCTELLRSLPPNVIPRPLDSDARRLLVDMALRTGGRGAYGRLLADSGSLLTARLGAAAGVPTDSLLRQWRAAILTSRPVPVVPSGWAVLAAIGWIVLLGACGTRSSRWRAS